jgi:hypothetical protein
MTQLLKAAMVATLLFLGAGVAMAQTSDTAEVESSSPSADAAPAPKFSFPVAELGNCDSKEACRLYCEQEKNREACFSFAQKVGLMSKEKVNAAKTLLKKQGPGGCNSRESCVAYCKDSSHQEECLSFAQQHKVISDEKVSLIKKFAGGEGPGACKSAETCRMYCEDPAHKDECRAFAEANNLGLGRKVGSSTVDRVKGVLASTTPGRDRGMELRKIHQGSTTPPGINKNDMPRKLSSTTPSNLKPNPSLRPPVKPRISTSTNEGLGAAVMRGFLRFLGF